MLQVEKPANTLEHLNILIYADPGVGKTFLCGTAEDDPRTSPVLIGDVEAGVVTLRNRGKNLDVYPIKNFERDVEAIYSHLLSGDHKYKCVVLDSGTELQKLSMQNLLQDAIAHDKEKDIDPDVPRLRDWGKNISQMRRVVRFFRDLPIHFIMTCLSMDSKDESTGAITIQPSLSGKLASEVAGFFDIVGHMYVTTTKNEKGEEVTQRYMRVQPTSKCVAKDRTASLGTIIKDPTIPMIMNMIFSTEKTNNVAKPQKKGQ